MKKLLQLFVIISLASCSTTTRDANSRAIATQTFGTDTNLMIREVMYAGPVTSALSSLGTSDELDLADAMIKANKQKLNLVIWSESSSKAAAVLLRALRYPGLQRLPQLQLLFIGDAKDAERVRPAVESTGAKFFWHPK